MSNNQLQAYITGAYIIMLLNHLSKEDSRKGSVIRLRNSLIYKLIKTPEVVSALVDRAYNLTREKFKDEKVELDIGILIESLAFNKEDYMKEIFGANIIDLVSRASIKIQLDTLTAKQSKDTYLVADIMKKDIEKTVFDYLKKK